jgi:hypothetical protein
MQYLNQFAFLVLSPVLLRHGFGITGGNCFQVSLKNYVTMG